jgi:hypothetical protein
MRAPLLLALTATVACGPSFQVVYEGDSRFEHCYALDENPNVLMQQKSDCWADWIQHYTYGQTRDRVEFAAVRYRAIMRAGALPTDEAIMGAAPGEGSGTSLAAPAPTNAFASPPKTMDEPTVGSSVTKPLPSPPPLDNNASSPPPVAPNPAAPQPPGSACIEVCSDKWQGCRAKCSTSSCDACDKTYASCAKTCLSGPTK